MTAERQERGTEWLAALDRLEEQLDPPLCEFVLGHPCGREARWHNRSDCHPTGGRLLCPQHKRIVDDFLLSHELRCTVCHRPQSLIWTKL